MDTDFTDLFQGRRRVSAVTSRPVQLGRATNFSPHYYANDAFLISFSIALIRNSLILNRASKRVYFVTRFLKIQVNVNNPDEVTYPVLVFTCQGKNTPRVYRYFSRMHLE